MIKFSKLESQDDIKQRVKIASDIELDISGGWGYDEKSALVIYSLQTTKPQFILMFATIRATIEMKSSESEDERYASIQLKELEKSEVIINDTVFTKVKFEISAMNQELYSSLIEEYKDGHGKAGFDLEKHFQKRKDNTILRDEEYWFKF